MDVRKFHGDAAGLDDSNDAKFNTRKFHGDATKNDDSDDDYYNYGDEVLNGLRFYDISKK